MILKQQWRNVEKEKKRHFSLCPHLVLKDSVANTIHGIYNYRNNAEKMRELYYLASLIDCMINQINPLLRTDLIKSMYNKITTLKGILNINWYGRMNEVILPIEPDLFNYRDYKTGLAGAGTMNELYKLIRKGSDKMFEILSSEYIFFVPGKGAENGN